MTAQSAGAALLRHDDPRHDEERHVYLYGVTPKGKGVNLDSDVACEVMTFGSLAAWIEWVPAEQFSPAAVAEKMKSIEWLGVAARRHEGVLELAMRHGPVFPARLCTLFTNLRALGESLAANEEHLLRAFERLTGRREWALKVYCDGDRTKRASSDSGEAQGAREGRAVGPGRAYVLAKQRQSRAAARARVLTDKVTEWVLELVEEIAIDLRVKPVLTERLTGRRETMLLNLATLLDEEAAESLQDVAAELSARLAGDGFFVEMSGPWPPYSFCDGEWSPAAGGYAEPGRSG